MRFKIIATAFLPALCRVSAAVQEPAPSRDWVRAYVSNTVQTATHVSDGTRVYTAGTGMSRIRLEVQEASVYALVATNATPASVSAGVTNGMHFVWDEASHSYTNHAQSVVATKTNFVWHAVQSDGCTFPGLFDVTGVRLQPAVAAEVTR